MAFNTAIKNHNQGLIDAWNRVVPVRSAVLIVHESGRVERTRTASRAWAGGGRVVVKVDDRAGGVAISQLIPIPIQVFDHDPVVI